MGRRSIIEPVIGRIKAEHRMSRSYLAHRKEDAIDTTLAAAGYNFALLLKWFRKLSSCIFALLINKNPKSIPT